MKCRTKDGRVFTQSLLRAVFEQEGQVISNIKNSLEINLNGNLVHLSNEKTASNPVSPTASPKICRVNQPTPISFNQTGLQNMAARMIQNQNKEATLPTEVDDIANNETTADRAFSPDTSKI